MHTINWRNWVLPLYLLLAMLLDGILSLNFQSIFYSSWVNASPQLMLIGFILLALYDDKNQKVIYLSLAFGLITDWFYFGFLGLYFIFLPLIVRGVQYVAKAVPMTFWARYVIVVAATIIFQLYQFILFNFMGLAQISVSGLLAGSLPFTIISNTILLILTYSLWNYLIEKYPFFQNKVN